MNRTVIVTGGSRGIGYSVAAGFAAAGDRVLITGRHQEPIEAAAAALGTSVTAAVCDASDPAEGAATARGYAERYLKLPNYTRNLERFGFTPADFANAGSDRLISQVIPKANRSASQIACTV